MLNKLTQFIERHLNTGGADIPLSGEQKQLACAALLVEVAMADHQFSEAEQQQLRASLTQKFQLDEQALDDLIATAQQESEYAASIHQFTLLVNNYCTAVEKFALVKAMWELALADGTLDKYEEHTIRKVADLIYLPHSEFIRAKSQARATAAR